MPTRTLSLAWAPLRPGATGTPRKLTAAAVGHQRLAPVAASRRSLPPRCRRHRPVAAAQAAAQQAAAGRIGDEFFTAGDNRPIILFDGVCNMCNGGVNFCLDWDKAGRFRFAALQSEAGRRLLQRSGRRPDDISSIVLVEPSGSYTKASAVLRIAQQLRAPLPLVALALDVFPRPLKDVVYDGVATNRYTIFGRSQSCRLSDPRFEDRFVSV